MKRSILVFSAILLLAIVSIASQYPPDYDYDYVYVRTPPTGLSAGWSGDDVYVSWDKAKDKSGDYVDGYRLHRAANSNSPYVLVNVTDGINNDNNYAWHYDESGGIKITEAIDEDSELIVNTYYTDTAALLSAAGVYESVPFSYMVTAVMRICNTAMEDIYCVDVSCFESDYSGPVEVVRASDYGCFIATAAFGSPLADEVKTLSSFRDEMLMQNKFGKLFVDCYYIASPPAADFIKEKPILKLLIRLHLKPIIMLAKFLSMRWQLWER